MKSKSVKRFIVGIASGLVRFTGVAGGHLRREKTKGGGLSKR